MREFRVVVKSMSFGAIQMQVQIPAVSLTIVTYNSLTYWCEFECVYFSEPQLPEKYIRV